MSGQTRWWLAILAVGAFPLACTTSEQNPSPILPEKTSFTCVECHTNAAMLQELAPPDTLTPVDAGET